MSITKEDLYANKYDYQTLKTNIYCVSLLDILKTQFLTADFCIKYILNEKYHLLNEEKTINVEIVKKYQPHLRDITNKIINLQRIDSIEDFETYMNRNI